MKSWKSIQSAGISALLAFACVGTPARAGIEPTPFLEFSVLQPGNPVLIDVRVPIPPPDPDIPVELLTLSLRGSIPVLPILLEAATASSGQQVKIDFVLGPGPNDGFPAAFDIAFDVGKHPGGGAAAVMGVEPTPFLPGPLSFFDVFFHVTLAGIGTVDQIAHFETLQPLAFSSVDVIESRGKGFSTGFDFDGRVPLNEALPLFTVTLSGSFASAPEPGTLALLGAGIVGFAAWRRRPSPRSETPRILLGRV